MKFLELISFSQVFVGIALTSQTNQVLFDLSVFDAVKTSLLRLLTTNNFFLLLCRGTIQNPLISFTYTKFQAMTNLRLYVFTVQSSTLTIKISIFTSSLSLRDPKAYA